MQLPNIEMPNRRFYTTNDPVMTPDLIDYFFNRKTRVFANLSERKKALLHIIYDLPDYRQVLPPLPQPADRSMVRQEGMSGGQDFVLLTGMALSRADVRAISVRV